MVLSAISQGKERIPCDTILASGGLVPLVHLWRHAGGKLDWRADIAAFVPRAAPESMAAIGATNGTFSLRAALAAARGEKPTSSTYTLKPISPDPTAKGRQWIDFQHDVTLKDIELAARENYVSVEHLKRYITLGMASDQGKTSNMSGLVAMAENGGSLRPAWFGSGPEEIPREALMARRSAAIFDASTLGKIEVIGPAAAAFLNFIYYNTNATLKPGGIAMALCSPSAAWSMMTAWSPAWIITASSSLARLPM